MAILGYFCLFFACFLWEGGTIAKFSTIFFFEIFHIKTRFQKGITYYIRTLLADLTAILKKRKKSFYYTFLNKMGFNPNSTPYKTLGAFLLDWIL